MKEKQRESYGLFTADDPCLFDRMPDHRCLRPDSGIRQCFRKQLVTIVSPRHLSFGTQPQIDLILPYRANEILVGSLEPLRKCQSGYGRNGSGRRRYRS